MSMSDPVHPGSVLREDVINDIGITVSEAATRLGVSRVTLSRVLNERARVSPALAVRLEEAGVGSARAWLDMQTAFDLNVERRSVPSGVQALGDAA